METSSPCVECPDGLKIHVWTVRFCPWAQRRTKKEAESGLSRFWSKVDRETGPVHPTLGRCWIWTAKRDHGYGRIRGGGRGTPWLCASRVSLEIKLGRNLAPAEHALHRCDNPPCVNPDHLFPGTDADNHRDCVEKGRTARGERNRSAKLTESQIREIRAEVSRGYRHGIYADIARRFGIHRTHARKVAVGSSWKHVTSTEAQS